MPGIECIGRHLVSGGETPRQLLRGGPVPTVRQPVLQGPAPGGLHRDVIELFAHVAAVGFDIGRIQSQQRLPGAHLVALHHQQRRDTAQLWRLHALYLPCRHDAPGRGDHDINLPQAGPGDTDGKQRQQQPQQAAPQRRGRGFLHLQRGGQELAGVITARHQRSALRASSAVVSQARMTGL